VSRVRFTAAHRVAFPGHILMNPCGQSAVNDRRIK
jgi:hypothetical protein